MARRILNGYRGRLTMDPRRQYTDRLAAFARVAATASTDHPLAETLRAVAEAVTAGSTAVACALILIDGRTGQPRVVECTGLPDGYAAGLEASWRSGVRSPTSAAIKEQRVALVHDAPRNALANPLYAPLHHFLHDVAWNTVLAVPLDSLGRHVGGLNAYYLPGVDPDEEEIAFIRSVADLGALAVENDRLLTEARRAARAAERQRLARDLHDSVSQELFTILVHARGTLATVSRAEEPSAGLRLAEDGLRLLVERSEAALAEMRALLVELHPHAVQELGLVAALDKQAAALSARERLPVCVEGPTTPLGLSPETEHELYRLTLEAVHNAVKHAQASQVQVTIAVVLPDEDAPSGAIDVRVSDDGVGFDLGSVDTGRLGLQTMRERAEQVGGSLTVTSTPGAGTVVQARVPTVRLPAQAAQAIPSRTTPADAIH